MADREKVIKGIRKCLSHKPCGDNECPFENECSVEHLNDPLLRDALALLKEQEAVKPTWSRGKSFCGACGLRICSGGKFCSECGRPVLWEGR